jgi:hypothetical protein
VELPSIRLTEKGQSCVAIALASMLLCACSTQSHPARNTAPIPSSTFEQELAGSCGQPVAYPISERCIAMMGSVGPLLQHRSDLIMKIWRNCPAENPCYRIAAAEPACGGAQPVSFGAVTQSCREAQEADHSCAALLKDPVYANLKQEGFAPDPYDCQRAKNALADLDREVESMSLRIQWYRAFAVQGF